MLTRAVIFRSRLFQSRQIELGQFARGAAQFASYHLPLSAHGLWLALATPHANRQQIGTVGWSLLTDVGVMKTRPDAGILPWLTGCLTAIIALMLFGLNGCPRSLR